MLYGGKINLVVRATETTDKQKLKKFKKSVDNKST